MLPNLRDCIISRDAPGATGETLNKFRDLCEQLRCQLEKQSEYFETNQLLFGILQMMYQDFLAGFQDKELKEINVRNKMVEVLS